jgi:hypothetical protein
MSFLEKNLDIRFSANRRISHRLRTARPKRAGIVEFEPISINDYDLLARKRIIRKKIKPWKNVILLHFLSKKGQVGLPEQRVIIH